MLYTDSASVHPVLKDFSPKRLCMMLRDCRINRRYLWPKASVHPVLKRLSWRVSVLIQTERRIDRRCPHSDRRVIWCYWLHCSSSAIHSAHLQTGSSVHPTVPTSFCLLRSVPTTPTLAPMALSVHSTVSLSFLFFRGFDPWKIDYLLNLACGIFASLGPRNVYKNMLNNMVSPIDHVVMNHQNHTRTNGIWGHVLYNLPLFGDLWQHKQSKHKFAKIDKIRTTYTCLDVYHHLNCP
jgi:hypothetical protein